MVWPVNSGGLLPKTGEYPWRVYVWQQKGACQRRQRENTLPRATRGIELEITNAPLGLYSSSLAAPFSERALYPKA